jgi:hypothetical protein
MAIGRWYDAAPMTPIAPVLLALALLPAISEDPLPDRPGHVPSKENPFASPRPAGADPEPSAPGTPSAASASTQAVPPPVDGGATPGPAPSSSQAAPGAPRSPAGPPPRPPGDAVTAAGAGGPGTPSPRGAAPVRPPPPTLVGAGALGEGGVAWFAEAGYPAVAAAWAQGLSSSDDAGVALRLDWTTSEMLLAGLWRHELSRSGGSRLAFRLAGGFWSDFGATWVYGGNAANLGIQAVPGIAWSTDGAGPGLLTFSLDAALTWAWQRGMGVVLAPDLAVAYEVPISEDLAVGGRASLWVRWGGGSADVAGLDSKVRGTVAATVTWRPF